MGSELVEIATACLASYSTRSSLLYVLSLRNYLSGSTNGGGGFKRVQGPEDGFGGDACLVGALAAD